MTEPAARPSVPSAGAPTVVVIGDALIDEIHRDGEIAEFVGGAALNVALGLAILGVRVTLIAMIGNDTDGARIRRLLQDCGVELIPTLGPNGTSRALSRRVNGEPSYEFNAAARARRIEFSNAQRAAISAAALVVVSCFPFDDIEQSDSLFASIDDAAGRLIIDPNPRAGMMHSITAFRESFERIARDSLLVKIGDDDSALLYGSSLDDAESHLLAVGCNALLGTAGKYGADVRTAAGIEALQPIADLPGRIVDTMGAGDAVLASVTQSMLADGIPSDEESWLKVLRRAMSIAAATCRHEGAQLRLP